MPKYVVFNSIIIRTPATNFRKKNIKNELKEKVRGICEMAFTSALHHRGRIRFDKFAYSSRRAIENKFSRRRRHNQRRIIRCDNIRVRT